MKRKPDLLWVLVVLFGLGMVTTGYTQSLLERNGEPMANEAPVNALPVAQAGSR